MKKILVILSLLFFIIGMGMAEVPKEQFVETGSIIAVVMLALPAFWGMYNIYGKRGIYAVIILGLFALIIETIGVHTGLPYSAFEYTMPFGYRLFGTTPWTVFVAWSPLVIGAWLLSQVWFRQWWSRFLVYLGLLVGADLVLDPGAVARGLWQYDHIGFWYGVPLQNFLGWILSGTIAYLILRTLLLKQEVSNRDIRLGSISLVLSLTLWTGVTVSYQLWLPALIGFILVTVLIFELIKKPSHQ